MWNIGRAFLAFSQKPSVTRTENGSHTYKHDTHIHMYIHIIYTYKSNSAPTYVAYSKICLLFTLGVGTNRSPSVCFYARAIKAEYKYSTQHNESQILYMF